jgi:hypothetical protein
MVIHWFKARGRNWRLKALVNGLGALVTAATFLIVAYSKFREGAWVVLILIPGLALVFRTVHLHYGKVARELTLRGLPPSLRALPRPRVIIPISGVHRGVIEALRYAESISSDIKAVYVEADGGAAERVRKDWERWGFEAELEIVPSPYRSIIGPILDFIDAEDARHNDGQLATIVLPEFVPARWWQALLHNQTAFLLKLALLYRKRRFGHVRAIVDIPFYLRE